ncbi:hypothetical protein EVAR_57933_1 [Eumeta japonica]|uniref:Uncharacterized protein n=1 Tax=Eumeta variegata TaxID=151549 RepID=A0A4C1ZQI2_EUMVA|nr:hypothetical protein EVAR_57933_1 [Eumeta japonica]
MIVLPGAVSDSTLSWEKPVSICGGPLDDLEPSRFAQCQLGLQTPVVTNTVTTHRIGDNVRLRPSGVHPISFNCLTASHYIFVKLRYLTSKALQADPAQVEGCDDRPFSGSEYVCCFPLDAYMSTLQTQGRDEKPRTFLCFECAPLAVKSYRGNYDDKSKEQIPDIEAYLVPLTEDLKPATLICCGLRAANNCYHLAMTTIRTDKVINPERFPRPPESPFEVAVRAVNFT